ncbi:MFS transporter [Solirubrobacter sp. CPCC 204708]|uniref:MFS transporter n=1 Tax=Solirubrobacter deserti TaxID=2282478 RepID=A0ABT4RJW2_9ACTN|nr:MFS transporter [Solirubrobacter deserti]MBE2315816.1 MFS transporter [Solirubrobacter deserti]MDA0138848.1 MFS transporter [Solirubrobacter deserti]
MNRYRTLIAIRGVRAPLLASTLGSVPIGMYGLAILLLVRDSGSSYGAAGLVVGAFSLANAFGAVAQGRLMDRFGQTGVLRVAAAGHLPALAALVLAATAGAPVWLLALLALSGGATLPQLPAAMRSLWNMLVADPELRASAYALVAVVFEVAVVTAPAVAAGISAVASPEVAVLVAGGLGVGSSLAFTGTGASRGWRGTPHDVGWLGPLGAPGMRTVFAVLVAFGMAVGIVQVAVPAYADARGAAETGGVLLAALSAGALVGGLIYGARTWPGALPARFPALLLGLGGGFALLAVADSNVVLAAVLLVCGLLMAPTTVVGSTLLDTVAPAGTVTEAFAAMVMGIVAGMAVGNALGGALVESASFEAAALVAGTAAAVGAAVALLRRSTLIG